MIDHEYDDPVLKCESLLQAQGVQPSAISEFRELYAPLFKNTWDPAAGKNVLLYRGDDARFRGLTLEEFIADLRSWKPHYWYSENLTDDAEASFGAAPSMAARGRLMREIGEAAYYDMARRWGSDGVSLKPGARPGSTQTKQEQKAEGAEAPRNNPWHPSWKGPDRVAAQTSIIRTSTKLAAGLAKAAGVTLAGTPLRS